MGRWLSVNDLFKPSMGEVPDPRHEKSAEVIQARRCFSPHATSLNLQVDF